MLQTSQSATLPSCAASPTLFMWPGFLLDPPRPMQASCPCQDTLPTSPAAGAASAAAASCPAAQQLHCPYGSQGLGLLRVKAGGPLHLHDASLRQRGEGGARWVGWERVGGREWVGRRGVSSTEAAAGAASGCRTSSINLGSRGAGSCRGSVAVAAACSRTESTSEVAQPVH